MGRYPKPPGQTRRPDRQYWRVLDPATGDVPPMPEREDGGSWTPEAERSWEAWWRSPMATAWLEADTVAVRRAIRLVDDAQRGQRHRLGARGAAGSARAHAGRTAAVAVARRAGADDRAVWRCRRAAAIPASASASRR